MLHEIKEYSKQDFLNGKILLFDKPLKWTSFDLVRKVRNTISKKFKIKKIKVGHAGTLDPLAKGLIIICTGKATKQISKLQCLKKSYTATIKLGESTASFDRETPVKNLFPINKITNSDLLETAKKFLGKQEQKPPIYSAIKINGEKLYLKARRGENINIPTRTIKISSFRITKINLPFFTCNIDCSKGTYIRSIANDFGKKLNNAAHLYALERNSIGKFKLKEAIILDDFLNKFSNP